MKEHIILSFVLNNVENPHLQESDWWVWQNDMKQILYSVNPLVCHKFSLCSLRT